MLPGIEIDVAPTELWQGEYDVVEGAPIRSYWCRWAELSRRAC